MQELAWPHIARGDTTLLLAPTGSGKTLAAFLAAIDRLALSPAPDENREYLCPPLDVFSNASPVPPTELPVSFNPLL